MWRVLYICAVPTSTGNQVITGKPAWSRHLNMSDLQTYRLPRVRVIRLSDLQDSSFPSVEDRAALEFDPICKLCKFGHVDIGTFHCPIVWKRWEPQTLQVGKLDGSEIISSNTFSTWYNFKRSGFRLWTPSKDQAFQPPHVQTSDPKPSNCLVL